MLDPGEVPGKLSQLSDLKISAKGIAAGSMMVTSVPVKGNTSFVTHDLFALLAFFPKGKSVSAIRELLIIHELMIFFQEGEEEKLYRFRFNSIYNILCEREP